MGSGCRWPPRACSPATTRPRAPRSALLRGWESRASRSATAATRFRRSCRPSCPDPGGRGGSGGGRRPRRDRRRIPQPLRHPRGQCALGSLVESAGHRAAAGRVLLRPLPRDHRGGLRRVADRVPSAQGPPQDGRVQGLPVGEDRRPAEGRDVPAGTGHGGLPEVLPDACRKRLCRPISLHADYGVEAPTEARRIDRTMQAIETDFRYLRSQFEAAFG